jgi:MYXO-CTERM domain-containing protein
VSEDGGTPTAEGDGGVVDGGDTGGGCSNEAPTHLPGTNGALMGLVALLGLRRKRRR